MIEDKHVGFSAGLSGYKVSRDSLAGNIAEYYSPRLDGGLGAWGLGLAAWKTRTRQCTGMDGAGGLASRPHATGTVYVSLGLPVEPQ